MQPFDPEVLRRFPVLEDVTDLEVARQSRDGSVRVKGKRGDVTVIIEAFPVGSTWENTYRGWLRIPESYRRAMHGRPQGFEFHVVMAGMLPDDDWRWLCVWPEELVRECEAMGLLQSVKEGRLHRINPRLLDSGRRPMVLENPSRFPSEEDQLSELRPSLVGIRPGRTVTLRGQVVKHNKGNVTIRFPAPLGTVDWAVVHSVVPEAVSG